MKKILVFLLAVCVAACALTLVACDPANYTLTYVIDGEVYSVSTVNPEEIPDFPINPDEKDGYSFDGWYIDAERTTLVDWENFFGEEKELTLYGTYRYRGEAHTITFVTDKELEVAPMTIYENEPMGALPLPMTDGYVFCGWHYTAERNYPYDASRGIATDITLYAQWMPLDPQLLNEVEISINYLTSEVANTALTLKQGEKITLNNPLRPGHKVVGYYIDEACLIPYDFSQIVTHPFTLYALWERDETQFAVRFEANGGTPVPTEYVTVNSHLSAPTTTRPGFVFAGWYVDSSLKEPFDFEASIITSSIVLYAKWIPEEKPDGFNVTFVKNNGEADEVYFFQKDSFFIYPDLTNGNATFMGWYVDEAFTTPYEFDANSKEDITVYARWEFAEAEEGFTFRRNQAGTGYILEGYTGGATVVIPAEYNSLPVVEIAPNTFAGQAITAVTIPESVRVIGDSAFEGCSALETLTVKGSNLAQIGTRAFYRSGVKRIHLLSGIQKIGREAFAYTPLTEVILTGPVEIEESAFAYCKSMVSFRADAALSLGVKALYECENLSTVTLKACVSIGDYAIAVVEGYNTTLTTLELPACTAIGYSGFYGLTALRNISVPKVQNVSGYAFFNTRIGEIALPEIQRIYGYAFDSCHSLSLVELGTSLISISYDAFNGCPNVSFAMDGHATFTVVDGSILTDNGKTLYLAGYSSTTYTIPAGVEKVGEMAFQAGNQVQTLVIPYTATYMEPMAVSTLAALAEVSISAANETYSIGEDGHLYSGTTLIRYLDGKGATEYTLSADITVSVGAFGGCKNLKTVTVDSSLTKIAFGTFYGCTSLVEVIGTQNVLVYEDFCFAGCTSLTTIVIHPDATVAEDSFTGTQVTGIAR